MGDNSIIIKFQRVFQLNKLLNRISASPLNLPEDFTITCHSGALNTEDNSLDSIIKLVEYGAQTVEIDVSFRPDGSPCAIHKNEPSQNEGAPLEDIFKAVAQSDTCKMNLDLKSFVNLPVIDELVEKYNLTGRAFYTGVGAEWCETVRNNSTLPYYLNASVVTDKLNPEKSAEKLCKKIKDCGAIGLNCQYNNVTSALCKALHKNNLLLSAWTADKKIIQCRLLAIGVDNITTKRPDSLDYCIVNWGRF
ncbi:MAG: glycerophosphodiester phosphodiesterase [Clostridia bacterium]|nr:glycerophosphodiester phosphodiesterase [Clostridia bacterium]